MRNQLSTLSCNVIFGMIPTSEEVYGMKDNGIPKWNKVEIENIEHVLNVAKEILDDVVIMVFVTSKHVVQHLGAICGQHGFKVHHVLTAACKPQIGWFQGIRIRFRYIVYLHIRAIYSEGFFNFICLCNSRATFVKCVSLFRSIGLGSV